jgi:glutamine synthetase
VIATVQRLLRAADVRVVRYLWCDNANRVRTKATHVDDTPSLRDGIALTLASQAVPVMYDAVVPGSGLTPVGEAVLRPDWETLAVLPFAPGQAHVMCDLVLDGEPWEHCPRAFLRAQVAALAEQGLRAETAFESEFVLMRRGAEGLEPVDRTTYALTGPLTTHAQLVDDVVRALSAHDIRLEHVHAESGPGQLEISIPRADPVTAADHQVAVRECVRGVAVRHGVVASFLPVLTEGAAGSGCHLNLSLWRDAAPATGDAGRDTSLSPEAEAFVAGVLHHLPAVAALTLATPNSYRRIRPHFWAGAYTAWGRGNREAAVRVTPGPGGAASRLEVKSVDASANPYLATGTVIAAGVDGLRRGLTLPPEVTIDPGNLDDDARRAGSVEPLPSDLAGALDALRADDVLLAALGEARATAYLAVKETESDALAGLPLADEVALLAERY